MRARSSAAETVAVPRLPTTTAAAALAARIAGSKPGIDGQHGGKDCHHGVARARHVAHLDRIGGDVDRLAAAPAPATCRLRCASPARPRWRSTLLSSAAAGGDLGNSLASVRRVTSASSCRFGRDQRRALVDGKVLALGIDDHRLAELLGRLDQGADHARREQRPWHNRRARRLPTRGSAASACSSTASSRSRARSACASSQSARSKWVEWCSETKRTLRVVGRDAIDEPDGVRSAARRAALRRACVRRRPRRPRRRRCSGRRARRCCARRCRRRRRRARSWSPPAPAPALPARCAPPRRRRTRRASGLRRRARSARP